MDEGKILFDKCNYMCYIHFSDMTTIDKKKFKKAVKRYREQNDLTQSELAQKLFTTTTTIARWELGISVPKSQRAIRDLENLGIRW